MPEPPAHSGHGQLPVTSSPRHPTQVRHTGTQPEGDGIRQRRVEAHEINKHLSPHTQTGGLEKQKITSLARQRRQMGGSPGLLQGTRDDPVPGCH